jgi:hypothetical protein
MTKKNLFVNKKIEKQIFNEKKLNQMSFFWTL